MKKYILLLALLSVPILAQDKAVSKQDATRGSQKIVIPLGSITIPADDTIQQDLKDMLDERYPVEKPRSGVQYIQVLQAHIRNLIIESLKAEINLQAYVRQEREAKKVLERKVTEESE